MKLDRYALKIPSVFNSCETRRFDEIFRSIAAKQEARGETLAPERRINVLFHLRMVSSYVACNYIMPFPWVISPEGMIFVPKKEYFVRQGAINPAEPRTFSVRENPSRD